MNKPDPPPIQDLVDGVRRGELTRARFMAILAGLGASAGGITTLLASTGADAATRHSRHMHHHATKRHNLALHHEHVRRQAGATHAGPDTASADALEAGRAEKLRAIVDDYAEHAVVEDPLFGRPFVGKEAIAARKRAEMVGMAGVTLEVANRYASGDQVVAEWTVRGTHQGDFMGFPATRRTIEVHGVTVVTRRNGKITRESLYYDVDDVYRQLG
jgi:steroid delta-isomerase-like uncharacterized protein